MQIILSLLPLILPASCTKTITVQPHVDIIYVDKTIVEPALKPVKVETCKNNTPCIKQVSNVVKNTNETRMKFNLLKSKYEADISYYETVIGQLNGKGKRS